MDIKPSKNEDEYFLKLDAELIKAHRDRLDAERRRAEQHRELSCPNCGTMLRETTHHHVKIDVCPKCKGAWLDAGELEMIEHVQESRVGTFLRDLLQGLPGK
jgi:uncharacterized protein